MPADSVTDRKKIFIIVAILSLLVIAVYWQVHNFQFINYDDQLYVTDNFRIQQDVSIASIKSAFTDIHTSHWHPLTMLSHMMDWQFFGKKAGMHHWSSVLIHLFNTLLLFWLFKAMTNVIWPSAFVAALFAVHPMNVESVAWIAERKNVLSTFFWMLTMLCYVRYAKSPNGRRYAAVLICFIMGLLSKAMLVTLPFVLFLMDFWPLNRTNVFNRAEPSGMPVSAGKEKISFLILEKIPLLILSAITTVITFYAMSSAGAVASLETLPFWKRVANALVSYVLYIQKLLLPVNLSAFYPHWEIPLWQVMAAAIFLIAVTFLLCKHFFKYPYLLVGWLWFLITLIPVIGLTQVGH